MIKDQEIKNFVDTKPGEGLLYYRLIEFLSIHGLYLDEDKEKQDFEEQVIDGRKRMSEKGREDILRNKNISSKVWEILKENGLLLEDNKIA